jgi:hypothetical protein
MTRIARAWGRLDPDQRLAAGSALGLFVTMFLPWYQQNGVVSSSKSPQLLSSDLNAFAVFSIVEAAVLLTAAAILFLLFVRAERRAWYLAPGYDGAIVFAGGIWALLLLILRLFDKPGIASNGVAANVGIQWGIFFALAAAGALTYAGSRMRRAGRDTGEVATRHPARSVADVRPRADAGEQLPLLAAAKPDEEATVVIAARSGRYPPAPGAHEQLSLEDRSHHHAGD